MGNCSERGRCLRHFAFCGAFFGESGVYGTWAGYGYGMVGYGLCFSSILLLGVARSQGR
jgi:hypothetical protein